MITEEKILEVKRQIKKGVPAGEIREEMIRDGYSKKDIDSCFTVKKFDMRSWFLFSAIIFLLGGLWVWSHPGNTVFDDKELHMFILSAGLFARYFWPEAKKKMDKMFNIKITPLN